MKLANVFVLRIQIRITWKPSGCPSTSVPILGRPEAPPAIVPKKIARTVCRRTIPRRTVRQRQPYSTYVHIKLNNSFKMKKMIDSYFSGVTAKAYSRCFEVFSFKSKRVKVINSTCVRCCSSYRHHIFTQVYDEACECVRV